MKLLMFFIVKIAHMNYRRKKKKLNIVKCFHTSGFECFHRLLGLIENAPAFTSSSKCSEGQNRMKMGQNRGPLMRGIKWRPLMQHYGLCLLFDFSLSNIPQVCLIFFIYDFIQETPSFFLMNWWLTVIHGLICKVSVQTLQSREAQKRKKKKGTQEKSVCIPTTSFQHWPWVWT